MILLPALALAAAGVGLAFIVVRTCHLASPAAALAFAGLLGPGGAALSRLFC
jgi:hypothetical protein